MHRAKNTRRSAWLRMKTWSSSGQAGLPGTRVFAFSANFLAQQNKPQQPLRVCAGLCGSAVESREREEEVEVGTVE